jgi:ATP-dependent protease ClpP protease subunit
MKKIVGISTLMFTLFAGTSALAAPACQVMFIGEVTYESVTMLLNEVNECPKNKKELPLVVIESPGGSSNAAQFAIQMLTDKVNTHIGYSVGSAGVLLGLMGKKRSMDDKDHIYIHDARWVGYGSEASSVVSPEDKKLDELDKNNLLPMARDDYVAYVASRTKLSDENVRSMMKATKIIRRDEALRLGFITTQDVLIN